MSRKVTTGAQPRNKMQVVQPIVFQIIPQNTQERDDIGNTEASSLNYSSLHWSACVCVCVCVCVCTGAGDGT
jgi:hypothetical protein